MSGQGNARLATSGPRNKTRQAAAPGARASITSQPKPAGFHTSQGTFSTTWNVPDQGLFLRGKDVFSGNRGRKRNQLVAASEAAQTMQAAARAAVRAWRAPAVRACWTGGDIGRGLWGAARARPPLAAGEQRAERGVAPGAWRQAGVAQAAPHGDCRRPLFTARAEADDAKDASPPPLSAEQKKVLFVSAAVPMVGFGFMDNMVRPHPAGTASLRGTASQPRDPP